MGFAVPDLRTQGKAQTMNGMFNKKSFTLMEMMIVVVLIGTLAAFAIPNYLLSVELAHLNDAMANLMAIHSANQAYRSERGGFWPRPPPSPPGDPAGDRDLTQINTNLSLAIVANGFTYTCRRMGGNPTTSYRCEAARQTGAYTLRMTQAAIDTAATCCGAPPPPFWPNCAVVGTCNPVCLAANCPALNP